MGVMVAGVVTVGATVELLGKLLDCGKLRWGPARDAVKAGSARAKMMEADEREIRETRGKPRWRRSVKWGSGINGGKWEKAVALGWPAEVAAIVKLGGGGCIWAAAAATNKAGKG